MLVILKVGCSKGDSTPEAPILYCEFALRYVSRVGEPLESWPDSWGEAKSVRVHRRFGDAHPEVDFGEISAYARPEDFRATLEAARADGWDDSWPGDAP
jgi:hypothetical protein